MKKPGHKILIVDDEEDLCEILQFNLEGEGFQTEVAFSAEQALTMEIGSFDLILLDVMMGEMSGFKLAKTIRREMGLSVPIVFITAKTAEDDLVTGFSLGGDDYITKPFSVKEVLVRVKAVLKRTAGKDQAVDPVIVVDRMELDYTRRKLKIKDRDVELTRKEFEILAILLQRQGYFLSREDLLDRVWDDHTIVTRRTVDVHMARLRKKLGKYGNYIRNKPGYGYVFEKPEKK